MLSMLGHRPCLDGIGFVHFFNPDEVFDVFNLPHQYGNETLTDLLSNYDVLFEEHLGKLNKITGKLYLKTDAKPVFCRARSLPYSVKPKVEVELELLQQLGVLEPVSWSDWATPIVPVI